MKKQTRHETEAMQHPSSEYDRPADVLKDDRLDNAQKRDVLVNWSNDLERALMAEDENMVRDNGKKPRQPSSDVLRDVMRCITKLNSMENANAHRR